MNNSVLQAETKATVMLVDDTPQNLVLMTELLREDYRILVANGGERALTLLGSETLPDLILLDVMMPDLDGHEVLRRIKANPATCDIPVIFLTAKSDLADEILGVHRLFRRGCVPTWLSRPPLIFCVTSPFTWSPK